MPGLATTCCQSCRHRFAPAGRPASLVVSHQTALGRETMSGSISTVAIHADRAVHPSRAVAPPIYQTATFWAEDAEQFAQAAVDRRGQGFYTRFRNPHHQPGAGGGAGLG